MKPNNPKYLSNKRLVESGKDIVNKYVQSEDEPRRLEIGTLIYPADFPELDKGRIVKAIMDEVERQLKESGVKVKPQSEKWWTDETGR